MNRRRFLSIASAAGAAAGPAALQAAGERPALTPAQRERVASLVLRTLELHNVSAIQVDYDAPSSEREFYRALLRWLFLDPTSDPPLHDGVSIVLSD